MGSRPCKLFRQGWFSGRVWSSRSLLPGFAVGLFQMAEAVDLYRLPQASRR